MGVHAWHIIIGTRVIWVTFSVLLLAWPADRKRK
jgi:hypothetical protein